VPDVCFGRRSSYCSEVLKIKSIKEQERKNIGVVFVRERQVLTVNSCIKVPLDLQADKSPVVVKGPFFPRVVNPRYRIRGTNV
jgi:hypothetical protein